MNIPFLNDVTITDVISTNNGTSENWNSNYTTTLGNSAFWQTAYTNLYSNSSAYLSGFDGSLLAVTSGKWDSNYTTTNTNSASWNSNYTTTNTLSSGWTDYGFIVPIVSNTLTLELSAFSFFLVYLNNNISSITFNNPKAAPLITSFVLQLSADGTARTVTWPVSIRWPGGSAPSVTSTANKVDTFTFFSYDSGLSYYGFATGTSS